MNFDIDVDIENPTNPDLMSTYTEKLLSKSNEGKEKRLQISGPVLMDWKNILIEHSDLKQSVNLLSDDKK
tara:strand:+ start:547 stop:756 length:210 start_codon:yes stop_codon:yes gene_type:complete